MSKKIDIYNRALEEADYVIMNKATIRQTAKAFKMSKSAVYRDVKVLLKEYSLDKSKKVEEVLSENKRLRHIRGGHATKRKYAK